MVDISTYGLQIIRAPDVIFLWPKWQLRCSNAREGKKTDREKKSDKRLQEKMGSVRWMMQAWTQALDLPTGSCPVTSKYNILPHDHWQPKTEMATKEVYLKLRMCCCFFVFLWFSVSETGFTTRTLMRAWIYCNWYNIRHQFLSLLFFSYHKLETLLWLPPVSLSLKAATAALILFKCMAQSE